MHIWGIKIVSPSILPLSLSHSLYIPLSLEQDDDRQDEYYSTIKHSYGQLRSQQRNNCACVWCLLREREREREKKGENHTVHLTLYKEDFRFSNHSMCCGSTRFASDCLSAKRSISPPLSIDTFFLKWMFTVRNNDM